MPHFLLEPTNLTTHSHNLSLPFAKRHNLSLPFGTTNFVNHFTFELIKKGAGETPQGS